MGTVGNMPQKDERERGGEGDPVHLLLRNATRINRNSSFALKDVSKSINPMAAATLLSLSLLLTFPCLVAAAASSFSPSLFFIY